MFGGRIWTSPYYRYGGCDYSYLSFGRDRLRVGRDARAFTKKVMGARQERKAVCTAVFGERRLYGGWFI